MLTTSEHVVTDSLADLVDLVEAYTGRSNLPVALDTETTGLSFLDDQLISLQFKQFEHSAVVFDVRHWTDDEWSVAADILQQLFDQCRVILANAQFDWKFLKMRGATIIHAYDVLLADQVIKGLGKSEGRSQKIFFRLADVAKRYGQAVEKETRNIFIGMRDRADEWNAPFFDEVIEYMVKDVDVLESIYLAQQPEIMRRHLRDTVNLECVAIPAIASTEFNGLYIERHGWRRFVGFKASEAEKLEFKAVEEIGGEVAKIRAKKFRAKMREYQAWCKARDQKEAECKAAWDALSEEERNGKKYQTYKKEYMAPWRELNKNPTRPKLETHLAESEWQDAHPDLWDLRQLCHKPINLSSPQQMLEVFAELNIPLKSTKKEELEQFPPGVYPLVDLLRAYREAEMFPTKFGDKFLDMIHPKTNRLHASYLAIGAGTGRMSCMDPPLQQLPSKGDGAKIRTFVQSEPGCKLLTADFSNIELRILADLSGDENMLAAFASGVDLHSYTARMMFGLDETVDVKKERVPGTKVVYRQVAKTINFGLVYGMSAYRLSRTLNISKEQAQGLMDTYFKMYPGVTKWLVKARRDGIANMYSVTVSGRKRYYSLPPDAQHTREYKQQRSAVERKAMNSPIQGSSADITKLALAWLWESYYRRGWDGKAKIVAVVHDEIVVEAPDELAEEAAEILGQVMRDACLYYLKSVVIPETEVVISDQWEKA